MKNITLALLTLSLLSACGQRAAAEAGAAASNQPPGAEEASFVVEQARRTLDGAVLAEQGAKRVLAYKGAMLPLVAGNYAGDCSTPAGIKSRAAITVAPDGAVSAPGMKTRAIMDEDVTLYVVTNASAGEPKALTFVAGREGDGWNVSGTHERGQPSVFMSANGLGISCENGGDAPAKPQAAYPAAAPFFVAAAATLQCTDGMSPAKPYQITPDAGGVRIGNEHYPLVRANAGEMLTAGGPDGGLAYRFEVIDGVTVQIHLDRSGKLSMFSAIGGPAKKVYSCLPELQS